MDINFELYKIFYFAATSLSFSEAADRLFITQSAVSQAIKNLETKLGVTLFFRKTRHLKLTPEGELLLTHIGQAYNFIKLGEEKMAETQNLSSGSIRIGASDTVCKYYLLPYLQQFNTEYPKVKIQVINRTSLQIAELITNGAVDFGIVTLPMEAKYIITTPIAKVEDIFVASLKKFQQFTNQPISLSELSSFPVLLLEKSSATRRNFDRYLEQFNVSIHPEIELESVDLLVEFARIGLGIAHVPRESAAQAIRRGELVELRFKEALPRRQLGVAQLQNLPLPKTARVFLEKIEVKCLN